MNHALRAATIGVLLLSPVALSACSAGQVTQTATQERDKTGAQAQVGDVVLRAGQLAYPRGGTYAQGDDAELQVAIVNGGTQDDSLVSVDGDGFASAEIQGASAGSTSSSSSAPSSTSSSASSSASSSSASSSSSSSSPTTSSSSAASQRIQIPAGQSVFVGGDGGTVTLIGLDQALTAGQYLKVTLTFEKAGAVTIPVSVAYSSDSANRSQAFDFNQTEGGGEG